MRKATTIDGVPPKLAQHYLPKTRPESDPTGETPLPTIHKPSTDQYSSTGPLFLDVKIPVLPAPAKTPLVSSAINLVPLELAIPEGTLVSQEIGFAPSEVGFVSLPPSPVVHAMPHMSDTEEEEIIVEQSLMDPSLALQVSSNPLFSSLAKDDMVVGCNLERRHSFSFRSERKFVRPFSSTREEIFEQLKDFSSHLRSLSIGTVPNNPPSDLSPDSPSPDLSPPDVLPKRGRPSKGFYLQLSQPQYPSHAMQTRSTKPSRSIISDD